MCFYVLLIGVLLQALPFRAANLLLFSELCKYIVEFNKNLLIFLFFWQKSSTFASEMSISSFIHSSGVRNFMKLLSANVVAQVIGLVVYPILTRMYSPEDFGLLNLFLSIGGVLVILSTAEYYYAIVLPEKEQDGAAVMGAGMVWLIITVLFTAISVLFSQPISSLFRLPALADYYWMMPIYVLIMGAWNLLNYWYIRHKKYNPISRYQISQNLLSAGGKLGLGYAQFLSGGMIYSVVFAPLISFASSIWKNQSILRGLFCHFSWKNIRIQANIFKNFPCFVLPKSFVNMLAGQLPILLLTPFFGARAVGFLSVAFLLGYTPIGTITRAIYQVLYQHVTERVHHSLPIGQVFQRFLLYTSAIIIPVFAGLWFILPDLTAWLLGTEWRLSGEYIQLMLPWLYVSLLSCSINFLFDIFMKQPLGLFFELLLAALRVAGLGIGIWLQDFSLSVLSYSIGTALALSIQIIWMMNQVKHYDASIGS